VRVFISHSATHDRSLAISFAERLRAEGYTSTFLSVDVVGGIQPGMEWERQLYVEMRRCDLVIYLSTRNSAKSKWCFAEIVLARSLNKPIIPIQCSDGEPDPLLSNTQWIDYFREGDLAFSRLWSTLRHRALSARLEWDARRDPYPGLRAFESADSGVFFGRGEDIERLLSCFRHGLDSKPQTVLVIGPSGSGKSSLVRAGLLPRLDRLPETWAVAVPLTPQESRGQGFARMLATQVAMTARAPREREYVLRAISEKPGGLVDAFRHLSAEQGIPNSRLLITIDQLEELVTVDEISAEERETLAEIIEASTFPGSPVWTVSTLRAEFLSRFLEEPSMAPFTKNQILVMPLDVRKYREVIEGPARLADIYFDPGLADEMIRDIPGADALPLLAYALQQLYIGSAGREPVRLVTTSDYRGLGGGANGLRGIEGVLVACADRAREELEDGDKAIALRTLLRFVNLDGHDEPTKRLVRRKDLDADESRVVSSFIEHRLLISKRGTDGVAYIDVAHEALFRVWTPLAEEIDAERSALRLRGDVERLALAWDAAGRNPSYYLTGDRLLAAEQIDQAGFLILSEENIIADFLRDSRRQDEAARSRFIDQIEERVSAYLIEDPELSILLAVAAAGEMGKSAATWLGLNTAVDASRLRGALTGHTAAILSVEFSPNGNLIATSSEDGTAMLWSAPEGSHQRTIDQHGSLVGSVSFSPDNMRLLTASADGKACIWDVATGFLLQTFLGHIGRVRHAAYSPDGQTLVTSGEDGTARIWAVGDGSEMAVLRGHAPDALILSCTFSPDGNLLVSTSSDHSAIVWEKQEPEGWRRRVVLRGHEDWVRAPSFSPDGTLIATASEDGTARIWRAADGSLVRIIDRHRGRVRGTSWSSDGNRLLTASGDGTARIWSTDSFLEIMSLRGHHNRLRGGTFSPDGSTVATASEDGIARLWTVAEDFPEAVIATGADRVRRASWSRVADTLAVALNDGRIQLWDARTRQRLIEIGAHPSRVSSALLSPDGMRFYSAGWDGTVRVWNTSGSLLSILAAFDSEVRWLELSPDGDLAAAALSDGTVQILSTGDGHIVGSLIGHNGRVLESRFSPDGSKVVSSGEDKTVRLWDLRSFAEIACLRGHFDWVRSASFSPDGSLIASAGEDATVRLWDVTSASEVRQFLGHEDWVRCVSFSPDGERLLTCSGDQTARVWMISSGQCCHILRGHEAMVLSAEYSPAGEMLVTGSYDGTIRLWNDLQYETLIDLARSRTFRYLSNEERHVHGLEQWDLDGETTE
jgi:WD40 repeat protein